MVTGVFAQMIVVWLGRGGVQLAKSLEKFFTGNSFEQSVDEQKVQFHWFGKKDRIQYLVQFCLERVKDIFTNHSFILKIVSQSQTLALWVKIWQERSK